MMSSPRSTRRRWSPAVKWIAPVDAFEHVAELCRRDHHRAVRSLWPDEAATLQPLGVERHAEAIMPENLDQLSVLAAEHIEIAAVRIALERFLHLQGQRVHAAAHVGAARGNPHPYSRSHWDHRCRPSASTATAAVSAAASTTPVIRIRAPVANSISIVPRSATGAASGAIPTRANPTRAPT